MHKVWTQIFINNVLISVLRINECNNTIRKICKQLKETAKDKLEVRFIHREPKPSDKK